MQNHVIVCFDIQSTHRHRGAVLPLQPQAEWLSTLVEENTCAVHEHYPRKARKGQNTTYIWNSLFFFSFLKHDTKKKSKYPDMSAAEVIRSHTDWGGDASVRFPPTNLANSITSCQSWSLTLYLWNLKKTRLIRKPLGHTSPRWETETIFRKN